MPIKVYKQLPLPSDSAFGRKTYNPIILLDRWLYRNFPTSWIYTNLNKFLFTPLQHFGQGMKNIYKWLPIIWKDRNWDHSYILEILQHKLILQREYLVSNNRHTMIDMDNKYITICLNLIERMKEEYYELEYFDYIDEDVWFIKYLEEPDLFEMKSKVNKENLGEYFDKYPLITSKIIEENPGISKQYAALKVGMENHRRCKKLLFKILDEKIEGWWD